MPASTAMYETTRGRRPDHRHALRIAIRGAAAVAAVVLPLVIAQGAAWAGPMMGC